MGPVRMDLTREEITWRWSPLSSGAAFGKGGHHTLEIQTYAAIDSGKRLGVSQTNKVKALMQLWEEKGLPKDAPDFSGRRNSYALPSSAKLWKEKLI